MYDIFLKAHLTRSGEASGFFEVSNIGTLTALLTTDKSSLVVAMNEVIGKMVTKEIKNITTSDQLKGYTGFFMCASAVSFNNVNFPVFTTGISIFFGGADGVVIAVQHGDNGIRCAYCNNGIWYGRTVL